MFADRHSSGLSLAASWRVERRVIWALLLRETMTRYGRHNIGFFWIFFEPMLFTLGVTALWTATNSLHGTGLPDRCVRADRVFQRLALAKHARALHPGFGTESCAPLPSQRQTDRYLSISPHA